VTRRSRFELGFAEVARTVEGPKNTRGRGVVSALVLDQLTAGLTLTVPTPSLRKTVLTAAPLPTTNGS